LPQETPEDMPQAGRSSGISHCPSSPATHSPTSPTGPPAPSSAQADIEAAIREAGVGGEEELDPQWDEEGERRPKTRERENSDITLVPVTPSVGASQADMVLHKREKWPSWNHATGQFTEIRAAFGIDPKEYAAAFPTKEEIEALDEGQHGSMSSLFNEIISDGASGSYFYFTRNKEYIVKTISEREHRVMMKVIESYKDYVVGRQGETFIHYYGCHSIQLPMQEPWGCCCNGDSEQAELNAERMYFVVMKNFLPVKMHMAFDLKGCTFKRRALKEGQMSRTLKGKVATLRDWEWMDIAMEIDVCPESKAHIAEVLESDCGWLARNALLDYSLLLGINRSNVHKSLPQGHIHLRRTTSKLSQPNTPQAAASRDEGDPCAFPSVDGRKVFFLGLVDILEQENCRWKVQHYLLRCFLALGCLCAFMDGITAMSPKSYADRFIYFLRREVLHCDADPELPQNTSLEAVKNRHRWEQLYANQRNGLVARRLKDETADRQAAMDELERMHRARDKLKREKQALLEELRELKQQFGVPLPVEAQAMELELNQACTEEVILEATPRLPPTYEIPSPAPSPPGGLPLG